MIFFWLQTLVHSHRVSLSNTLYSYYLAPCPASELDIVRLKCDERLGEAREQRRVRTAAALRLHTLLWGSVSDVRNKLALLWGEAQKKIA